MTELIVGTNDEPPSVARMWLSCPACHGRLEWGSDEIRCTRCGAVFPIIEGVPALVLQVSAIDHDELDHLSGSHRDHSPTDRSHKAEQASYYDRAALAEFEIERPFTSPSLYRFLLEEKFRRSIEPLGGRLDGWTALTVCGGSGMDAELLARAGADVISSDLSIGAGARVAERARRHAMSIEPVVADVEHLPFADRSVDLVYVHDGLHHLENPLAGLAEMARVARRAVSITEPARATATSVGVRLGLALEREEAGNLVARLDPAVVTAKLEAAGFRILRANRYAMYYRHVPGRVMGALSQPWILPAAIAGWRLGDRILGRLGNKLVVAAERRDAPVG